MGSNEQPVQCCMHIVLRSLWFFFFFLPFLVEIWCSAKHFAVLFYFACIIIATFSVCLFITLMHYFLLNWCVCAWLSDECMYFVCSRFEKLIRACVVICLIDIDHKTSLTPSLFIEVPVTSQEIERSCNMCEGYRFCLCYTIFWLGFRSVLTVWYIFVFHS